MPGGPARPGAFGDPGFNIPHWVLEYPMGYGTNGGQQGTYGRRVAQGARSML